MNGEGIVSNDRCVWILAAASAVLLDGLAGPVWAEPVLPSTSLTVQPSGTTTWDDMRRSGIEIPPPVTPRVVPFMAGPPPRDLPPGESATKPEPPPQSAESSSTRGGEPLAPQLGTGFAALGDDGTTIPPDTMGAAGPNHLMVMLNSQVRILNKSGGHVSVVGLSAFWTSPGTGLSGSPFDPKLVFDSGTSRWLAVVDANAKSATSQVWLAVSQSSDPTGAWRFFSFTADSTGVTWADYPGLGFNQTWVSITNNMFPVGPGLFQGSKMWVIDKSTALGSGALTVNVFDTGFDNGGGCTGSTLQPAVTFGSEPKLYLLDQSGWRSGSTNLLRVSRITGTAAAPAWSPQPGSAVSCGGGETGFFSVQRSFNRTQVKAPQRGTTALIETNDERLLNAVFRNGRIWGVHTGGLPDEPSTADRTAVFWYEIDPASMPSPIVQSGVVDGGAGVHHTFPSIAVNASNDMCLGFSRSDATRFAEAVATGRSAGDSAGTVGPIQVVKAGEDVYRKDFGKGKVRWGDYSATSIDPSDDRTCWTIQEFAAQAAGPAPAQDLWSTWWARLDFPAAVFAGGVFVAGGNLDGVGATEIVTGAGAGGGPHVRAFNADNTAAGVSFFAYDASFRGGVRIASCDVDGDGKADIITGAGPGGGPHVRVFRKDLTEIFSFFAYDPSFTGGVFVACGDVNGDGRADIITGAGAGGGPHVRVFDGRNLAEIRSFFAYDPRFTGGVFVAAGDVNGDGKADIITGAGPGGGPHVRVFDGATLAEIHGFFAYDPGFTGGVTVAAGDLNGDGKADIITGAGAGGGPHVRAFNGVDLSPLASFFAYGPSFRGGVFVGAGNLDGIGPLEILTGAGPGGGPHVRGFTANGTPTGTSFFAY